MVEPMRIGVWMNDSESEMSLDGVQFRSRVGNPAEAIASRKPWAKRSGPHWLARAAALRPKRDRNDSSW